MDTVFPCWKINADAFDNLLSLFQFRVNCTQSDPKTSGGCPHAAQAPLDAIGR
jgi:hypothetical protein